MRLWMAGVDYTTAGLAVREQFSLPDAAAGRALDAVRSDPGVHGCVLLSTCNRTELYVVSEEDPDPAALLCRALGMDPSRYSEYLIAREGRAAVSHLMMVACGLRSQIRGEDQILTQVKSAIRLARERGCAEAELETLFRCAVSAAKKAKTVAPIAPVERSLAAKAVDVLEAQVGTFEDMSALVIGNGEMGRLASALLRERGCAVTVTLRSYRHGATFVPPGCMTVPYAERYGVMAGVDAVFSATTSPHHTVTEAEFAALEKRPKYLFDLAVPRDIEPAAGTVQGVRYWNVDTLGGNAPGRESRKNILRTLKVIGEYRERFYRWQSFRTAIPADGRRSG